MIEDVAALIRQVSARELLPRFGRLGADAIFSKASERDPDDVVTAADRAAEAALTQGLQARVPGAIVVGEEAAHADPALLGRVGEEVVLVVDPLDGTRNFVAGDGRWGTMVALVRRGETEAAWIHMPVTDRMFVARRGGGATLNGAPLRAGGAGRALTGTLYTRFMPPALAAEVQARAASLQVVAPSGCAAAEYAAIATGERDFVVYHRLMPWDHAPGALIVAEAGGVARHPDGAPYRATDADRPTVVAADEARWAAARAALFG